MAKAFPHIADTPFPHIDNENVYEYENVFDYAVWKPGARLKLCRVAWRSNYEDVVEWESTKARDKYFDELSGAIAEPVTISRRVDNYVRINLSYPEAMQYNYLVTDYFPMPVPGSKEKRRLFYFIDSVEYLAPNTTGLVLIPDIWTSYRFDVSITSAILERGHAPADATSVETYFSNPREIIGRLGGRETDYTGTGETVASADNYSPWAGEKTCVFALPVAPDELAALLALPNTTGYSPASFSDASGRDGYQRTISGLNFGSQNVPSYENARAVVDPVATPFNRTPGLYLYTLDSFDVFDVTAFEMFARNYPEFISFTEAFFIVPSEILQTEYAVTRGEYTIRHVTGTNSLDYSHVLRASDFDISTTYAKAYTWPYAWYSLDTFDSSIPIRIENCENNIHVENMFSLSTSALEWIAAATNVSGSGVESMSWTQLNNEQTNTIEWPNAPWRDYVVELGIPTYELRLAGDIATMLSRSFDAEVAQDSAEVAYLNATRSINTSRENTVDSNATMVANTANNGATSTTNVGIVTAGNTANSDYASLQSSGLSATAKINAQANAGLDNALNSDLVTTRNDATAIATQNSINGSVGGALVSGGVMGLVGAIAAGATGPAGLAIGAAVGAASSALSPALNAYTTDANSAISINLTATQQTAIASRNSQRTTNSADQAIQHTTVANQLREYTVATNNSVSTQTNANNVNNANTNAANSQTRGNANATYSRNAAVANAQDNLNLAARNFARTIQAENMKTPARYSTRSGDAFSDELGRKGITIRAHQASADALANLNSDFQRFGYRYDRPYRFDNVLTTGRKWAYVQLGSILEWTSNTIQSNVDILFAILQAGARVWADPANVGGVPINER